MRPPKHRVFLSHSGLQKDFVEQLCVDLERVHHFPFFDKRTDSLPRGEIFPPLIFQAAQQCCVAVLVLSPEYFTRSKWPMLELSAFVDAQSSSNPNLKLLPLFFKLSCSKFNDAASRSQWLQVWEAWAATDHRIDIPKWQKAIRVVGSANGMELSQFQGEVSYRVAVVDSICKLLPPNIRFDDSHIQGQERLCQAIVPFFEEEVVESAVQWPARVVGMHGIGGKGKTTICKVMCNYFHSSFHGKVCHVELGKMSLIELQKKVLRELTEAGDVLLQRVEDAGQGQELLKDRLHQHKVFLALDNVEDCQESIEQAQLFLKAGFSPDSKVLVTARGLSVLERLLGRNGRFMHVPDLERQEAIGIFLDHATPNLPFSSFSVESQGIINDCVMRCFNYHPLALKALGAQLSITSSQGFLEWKERISKVDFKRSRDAIHPIFSILRTGYDALPSDMDKLLFLDVALYAPRSKLKSVNTLCQWLSDVHGKDPHDIMDMLNGLRIKTLLEDWVDLTSPVRMHELYREFAELEASAGDMKRWCIFQEAAMRLPVNLQKNQEYDLLRVNLPLGTFGSIPRGLLKEWFNLGVLELPYCYQLTQLDLRGMRNLHTVGLRDCNKLVEIHCSNSIGKFDRLLLKLKCTNLEILSEKFGYLAALQILDIKDCASLTKAPDLGLCINLQELNMSNCYRLTTPPDLSRCVNLVKLNMSKCHRLKHPPKLDRCIKLQELNMYGNSDLTQLPRFHKLSALEKLEFSNCENVTKVVGLRSLSNLQDLRLACTEVGKLQGLGCLMALRRLNLIGCTRMKHIEDMSALTNLQEIWLQGSGLCKLPGLGKLNTLEMLDLRCDVINNFPDLSPFASLRQLWIGSSQVTAVLGIDKLLQLEEIEFTNCELLTQIPDLRGLPNLSFVWLINCSCVGNLLQLPESCILRECLPEEGNLRTSKTYNGRVEPISDILVC